jgi:hypothetical protein
MDRASELVLGFAMRTDAKVIKYPDRFMDPRGAETWRNIMKLLDQIEREGHAELGECATKDMNDRSEPEQKEIVQIYEPR